MKAEAIEDNMEEDRQHNDNREQLYNRSLIIKTVLKGLLRTNGLNTGKDNQGEFHE